MARQWLCPIVACGICRFCLNGNRSRCPKRVTLGYDENGGLAEFVLIPEAVIRLGHVFVLPPGLSLKQASLLEPASCVLSSLETLGLITDSTLDAVWIRLQSAPPYPGGREAVLAELRGDKAPTNQAVVANHPPAFAWNGLRFRSKTEMVLAQAFSRSRVLYFPLAAAVSGQRKFEPDFLVCHDGEWGILEVHGDDFHPPQTAAREHERGRWFQERGVRVFQVFNATDCFNDPDGVVQRFLKLLAAS